MANISKELDQIQHAIYGSDMRSAIHQGLFKLNKQVSEDVINDISDLKDDMTRVKDKSESYGTNLWIDTESNLLYLTNENGEPISDGVVAPTGGGGGGGGSVISYKPNVRAIGDRTLNVSGSQTVRLTFEYTSVDENGADDGPGTGVITIGGSRKRSWSVPQGTNTVDITSYLSAGTNNLILRVENSEGVSKSVKYTITVIALSMSTNFAPIDRYSGSVQFEYTVSGAGTKQIHYLVDGTEIDVEDAGERLTQNRTYSIPEQSHGNHIFECYASADVDGILVESNRIRLSMIWVVSGNSRPIVGTTYVAPESGVVQGDPIAIPYMVIDPANNPATVTLSVYDANGDVYGTPSVVSKGQTLGDPWIVTDYPVGNIKFRIACRDTHIDIPVTVEAYVFPISKVTDALTMEFVPDGRSNLENNPASWSYGEGASKIEAAFEGFAWFGHDGWLSDDANAPILRFLPGDIMTLPYYYLNQNDITQSGYTVEVDFATRDVRSEDTVVIDYLSNSIGFRISTQDARMASKNNKQISMEFNENARIRVNYVIESNKASRFMYVYINGILCGINQYDANDDFLQPSRAALTIGAESCGLDLYRIRTYSRALTAREVVDNLIVDKTTFDDRREAYERNDIFNNDEVSIEKLPKDLPYLIIMSPRLPQYKGDKINDVTLRFVDPANPKKNFTASGCTINVQGTSSQFYPVKNELLECPEGFEVGPDNATVHADGYSINDGDIPVDTFCVKVDYASSENANNVVLVEIYERVCREMGWLTPPQEENTHVRQGIAGRPIAMFWQNTNTGTVTFVGKGNFNNDKSTADVFGFSDGAESWEFLKNFLPYVEFKANDFSSKDKWENELECRYPNKKYTNTTKLKRVFDFVVAHNWEDATVKSNFSNDKSTMLADFKAHFNEYFDRNLTLFYYLFTAQFIMMDSRAKNMFLTTYDGIHWLPLPYDFDTALGI